MRSKMSDLPESMNHYLAMWNELDPDRIRLHLDKAVSEDMIFADPRNFHVGRDELEHNVLVFRRRFPDAVLGIASGVDEQHSRYRYEWEIHRSGELLIQGFDVTTINDAGLIERVDGFFGPLPPKG